jgi:putative salt-induced outer membrane protein YdiY
MRRLVRMKPAISSLLAFALALGTSAAHADDQVPQGTTKDVSVSKGKTEVTSEGFQAAQKKNADKDATTLSVGAGALVTTGNTRLGAFTGNEKFRLRRSDNQLSVDAAANYSRSATTPNVAMQTTVENYQGRVRYDRFFEGPYTAFLGVQGRRDRFAGLDLRLQIDPGLGYYFVNQADTLVWVEAGYDFLYDIRADDARVQPDGTILDKTKIVNGARGFFGFTSKLNEGTSIGGDAEYLQGLADLSVWRLNIDLTVTAKLSKRFSLATAFLARYDHAPLPGKEHLDLVTSLNLVFEAL